MSWFLHLFQDYSLSIFFVSVIACIVSSILPIVSYRLPMLMIALFFALSSIYLKGGEDQRLKSEVIDSKAKADIAVYEKQQSELTAAAAASAATNRALVIENGRLKDVKNYITSSEETACNIGSGFIRLHNESAQGKVSNTTK